MSRSRKRNPVIKDGGASRDYNKMFRRVNKVRLQKGKYLFLMNEIVNQWDICDWKHWDYDNPAIYRK